MTAIPTDDGFLIPEATAPARKQTPEDIELDVLRDAMFVHSTDGPFDYYTDGFISTQVVHYYPDGLRGIGHRHYGRGNKIRVLLSPECEPPDRTYFVDLTMEEAAELSNNLSVAIRNSCRVTEIKDQLAAARNPIRQSINARKQTSP